jgi:integrase
MGYDRRRRGEPAGAKTARGRRQLALDGATVAALQAWRKRQLEERLALGAGYTDNDLIFCRADGLPYSPGYISAEFKSQAKAAKLPTIRLHDLRHTHASLMLPQGIHPEGGQREVGTRLHSLHDGHLRTHDAGSTRRCCRVCGGPARRHFADRSLAIRLQSAVREAVSPVPRAGLEPAPPD